MFVVKKVFLFSHINIYMNYLISSFDCLLAGEVVNKIDAGVKYKILNTENDFATIYAEHMIPYLFQLNAENEHYFKVDLKFDNYYILCPNYMCGCCNNIVKFKNREYVVSLSSLLHISCNENIICEKQVHNIKFSHYETLKDFLILYFSGARPFVVVIKNDDLCFADYYDELNNLEEEKYFMCKLKDSLNHGRVCHLKGDECSTYLVYLDDSEMLLKDEFVACVFLDCVLAKNFKYCNLLLDDSLKMENEKEISKFFPEFDWFCCVEQNVCILKNKNTLAGIFEFEINNNKIFNIKLLN